MSLDNAKKSITILGVLNIIFGLFGIGLGIAFLSGGNMLGKSVIETAAPAAEGATEALTMSGIMLVLGVFVLVAAVAGWRGWQWYQGHQAGQAMGYFEALESAAAYGKTDRHE